MSAAAILVWALAPAVAAGVLVAAGGVVWWWQERRITAATPAGADLAAPLPVTCGWCPARHCAGCEAPARVMATRTDYQAQHSLDEVPPSLLTLASLLPVGLRAMWLARRINPRWWPHGGGSRAGLEAWARKVARRHGIPSLLGTFRKVALP